MSESSIYPESLERVITSFSRLPGIGRRTGERLALALLGWPDDSVADFARCLGELKQNIKFCRQCGNFTEEELCWICRSASRNPKQVCVVEEATQIPVIEKSGSFKGQYHVLGGRLVPLEDIGPENLRIQELHQRIQDQDVQEIILATGSDIEGEATASFVAGELSDYPVTVSRIASGVPVGADLNYADSATIAMAINKRSSWDKGETL
ncbi:MAG: recombination mediator RecR [Verrucomicrobiota bacterium]